MDKDLRCCWCCCCCWWLVDGVDGESFSFLNLLFWIGLNDEVAERLYERVLNDETFSGIVCRYWRSGAAIVEKLSMFRRFLAEGLVLFRVNAFKSRKSFSIDNWHRESFRLGLIGHGIGLAGGLFSVKNEISSNIVGVWQIMSKLLLYRPDGDEFDVNVDWLEL